MVDDYSILAAEILFHDLPVHLVRMCYAGNET